MDTEIEEVKQEIRKVQDQIDGVEERQAAAKGDDVAYLRKKEEQLRKEKQQLRKKEEQLRKDKEQLREEKLVLLKARTSDLVVQNEKSRKRCDDMIRDTATIKEVKKRVGEYIEKSGKSKRPTFFQEPLWHRVPSFSGQTSKWLDKRFTKLSETDVLVMGRSALGPFRQKVYDMITDNLRTDGGYPINVEIMLVHGPMGSGKSHIVFLLIWDLNQEFASRPVNPGSPRVRIVPIIDCNMVVDNSVRGLLDPLLWAFADDQKSIHELGAISDAEQLVDFLRSTQDILVYVLDQWQVLENHRDARQHLISIMGSAKRSFQVRVTSAAGEELKAEFLTTHSKAHVYPVSGGLTKEELANFNLLHGTECETEAVQALVDEQLGRNPFMLALWGRHWSDCRGSSSQSLYENYLNQFKEPSTGGETSMLGVGEAVDKHLPEGQGGNVLRVAGGDGARKGKETAAEDGTGASGGTRKGKEAAAQDGAEASGRTEGEARDWEAWYSFINSAEVKSIRTSIRSMLDALKLDIILHTEMVEVLRNIVFNGRDMIFDNHNILSSINLRYFVIDEAGSLSCAFPLVRTELARFLGEIDEGNTLFHSFTAWVALEAAVRSQEPSGVVGLLAERCCNAAIAVGGGHEAILECKTRKKPTVIYFPTGSEEKVAREAVSEFRKGGSKEACVMFLPQSPFYEAVDNIVVRLYRGKKKNGIEKDICMDLVKTRVTVQSMEKHSKSTIVAMAPKAILPWIGLVTGKVQVTMAYVVPEHTIKPDKQKIKFEGSKLNTRNGGQGQMDYTVLQIPFHKVHTKLEILDTKWS